MEANFYLESAAWSIEDAVVLWLENNPTSYFVPKRTGLFCNPIQSSFCNSYGYNSYSHSNDKCLWVGRDVLIEGLPQEWSARVNPRTGTIEFVHSVTGITQIEVPPGFADSNGADADGNNTLDNNGNNSFSNSYANNDGNSYGNSYGSSYGNNNDNSHDNCNNSMDGAESTTAEYGMDDSVEVQIDNDRTSICDRDNTQSPDNSTK